MTQGATGRRPDRTTFNQKGMDLDTSCTGRLRALQNASQNLSQKVAIRRTTFQRCRNSSSVSRDRAGGARNPRGSTEPRSAGGGGGTVEKLLECASANGGKTLTSTTRPQADSLEDLARLHGHHKCEPGVGLNLRPIVGGSFVADSARASPWHTEAAAAGKRIAILGGMIGLLIVATRARRLLAR